MKTFAGCSSLKLSGISHSKLILPISPVSMFSCITRITVIGAPTSFRRTRDVDPLICESTHLPYFLSVSSTLTLENGPARVISSACLKKISSFKPYWIIMSWIGSLKALFIRVPNALNYGFSEFVRASNFIPPPVAYRIKSFWKFEPSELLVFGRISTSLFLAFSVSCLTS